VQWSKYRLTDILWQTRQGDVWAEIAAKLNMELANTQTLGWFEMRMTTMKNILNKMTEEEKSKLQEEADRMAKEGLPAEIQRK